MANAQDEPVMKLDPKVGIATQAAAAKAAQPFKKLLAEARSELKPKQPPPIQVNVSTTASVVRAAQSSGSVSVASQVRQQARVHAETEASRLNTVRADHSQRAESLTHVRTESTQDLAERSNGRIIDFILKELGGNESNASNSNMTPPPTPTGEIATVHPIRSAALQAQPAQKLDEAPPETRATQAVALIEKIETFVRSQRPGLALTLNNSLGASVEIERIGPREIALKLVGHMGPPSADAVSRIRDELRARGLKVGALSVA
ncbi:MAG: hypothetical protein JNM17_25730 [Archangium sp.]|nr:hypothetical protein [Archangium sp.]